MPPTPTQLALINNIEGLSLLNHRYKNLTCINGRSPSRRGRLSLVFQALDILENKYVAIKFMDPEYINIKYRLDSFEREPTILQKLQGRKRALQLTADLDRYQWVVTASGNQQIPIPCDFFASEWIEEDVDDYFLKQHEFTNKEKLQIFRGALLAINTIHSENLFHRDLKINNLRLKVVDNESIVVIIDFGTAASLWSTNIGTSYPNPVGAPGFSAPETFVGFSSERKICQLTDMYAAGTLLFDLFNVREFNKERSRNTSFNQVRLAITAELNKAKSNDEKFEIWKKCVREFKYRTDAPAIDGPNNSISPSILQLIKKLYGELTEFDFNQRLSDHNRALRITDSMLRVIDNEKKYQREIEAKKIRRRQREEKAKRKEDELDSYLTHKHTAKIC